MRSTETAILPGRSEDSRGADVRSQANGLPQHLKEILDGEGKVGKRAVQVHESRTVKRAVEKTADSWISGLHLADFLRVRT